MRLAARAAVGGGGASIPAAQSWEMPVMIHQPPPSPQPTLERPPSEGLYRDPVPRPEDAAAQGGWRPEPRADRMSVSSVSTTRGRFAAGAGSRAASSSDDDASSSGAAELPVPRTMRDGGAASIASTSMAASGDAMKP